MHFPTNSIAMPFGVALILMSAESAEAVASKMRYCSIDPEHTMCKFRERSCPGDVLFSKSD